MRWLITTLFVFLLFGMLINFVSASFQIGNISYEIQKEYAPGENVKGWLNISFANEPANSVFSDRTHSINLIDLIKLNQGFVYSCSVRDCSSDYIASSPSATKDFNMTQNGVKLIGFKFIGNISSISYINFTLESDAAPSCSNQLKIDIANDGTYEIGNTNPSSALCYFNDGCFNENTQYTEYSVSETSYCQRLNLTEAPGFKIGAWVRKEGSETGNLTMGFYNEEGEEKDSCTLPQATSGWSELSCDIEHLVNDKKDYYVCIYKSSGNIDARIKGYETNNGCGYFGGPGFGNSGAAYGIFAKGKGFGNVGTLNISNSLPSGTFSSIVQDYLIKKYGVSLGCGGGCIMPIKIISTTNQQVTLSNLKIKYSTSTGEKTEASFYELQETPATLTANFQKLHINNGNFSAPMNFGNATFQLKLNNYVLFSENISVERIPTITSLNPVTVAAAYPTEFTVSVDTHNSSANITNYKWEFGDNATETTAVNKATHTYNSVGSFNMKITITNSEGLSSSKNFSIAVEAPKEAVNFLLGKKLTDLINLKSSISGLPSFYQTSLEKILNISSIDETLTEIQRLNASASRDEDYITIMGLLVGLDFPKEIITSKSADEIPFFLKESNIDVDVLKEISGSGNGSDTEYIDAILAWNQKNLKTKINFKELSAKYDSSENPILKVFEINIEKQSSGDAYFIIPEFANLKFKEDYSERNESEYFYIALEDAQQTITFSTTEDVDFSDLPLFISPAVSDLAIEESAEEGFSKTIIFILVIVALIILGFGTYLFLRNWYKKKYESYLFKNKNDLYNIVTYVATSKRKGLEDREIAAQLKKAGWSSEQITYVLRKYAGKRTGMPEISMGKFFSRNKNKNVRRQNNYGSTMPPKKY